MLQNILLILPALVCLFWGVILLLRKEKSSGKRIITFLSILASIYFVLDFQYVTHESNYRAIVHLDYISQFVVLSLFPTIILYFLNMVGKKLPASIIVSSYVPAFLQSGFLAISSFVIGTDKAASYLASGGSRFFYSGTIYDLYDALALKSFAVLNIIWTLITIGILVYILRHNDYVFGDSIKFFFKKKASSPVNISALLMMTLLVVWIFRVAVGRLFLLHNTTISALSSLVMAVLVFLIYYISNWFENTKVLFSDLGSPSGRTEVIPDKYLDIDEDKAVKEAFKPAAKDSLYTRFVNYILEKKPYLNPELTIENVAQDLGSNRTYISMVIKESFQTNFRSYINNLRVEEAKRLLIANQNDKLDTIASKSGFASDSQLIKKFSEITGMTPRTWLNSIRQSNHSDNGRSGQDIEITGNL